MYRIDNSTAATSLPTPAAVGPNPNGFFTNGSPGVVPATVVDQDWANAVQEEIAGVITNAGITLDKTNRAQLTAAIAVKIATVNPGRLLRIVPFTANGTWTKGAGTTAICVKRIIGGGSSGGGSLATSSSVCSTASGGATGSCAQDVWFDVTSTATAAVTIGAGGGASTGAGNAGGTTSLVASAFSISCPGGGVAAVKQDNTSVTFDVSAQAPPGGSPTISNSLYVGMSSSGAPGPVGLLFSGSVVSGQGASSPLGGGGLNTNSGNGGSAQGFGAGGGGGAAPPSSGNVTGGAGSQGYIEIWEYSAL